MARLRALLSLFVYLSVAYGQQQPSDLIWQLGDVNRYRPTRSPYLGYQNFTWCCVKAVAQALEVKSGLLEFRPGYDDWIVLDSGNISDLVEYTDSSLFPCTATYVKGNNKGTPIVQVPYKWFAEVCPGWQLNDNTNLNAWLQPLSGFILPAVIFCLSVPRRRKLGVPRALFSPELARSSSYLVVLPGAILAGIMVSIDTIIWLCTCFAFAGPMILSGLYEALLDNRILDFVKERIRNKNLTLDMRCRLLMIVLIGNLDLALDESQDTQTVQSEGPQSPSQSRAHRLAPTVPTSPPASNNDDESADQSSTAFETESQSPTTREQSGSRTTQSSVTAQARNRMGQEPSTNVVRRSTDHLQASPWRHMEELLYDIRLYEANVSAQEFSPRQTICENTNPCIVPRPRTKKMEKQIRKTKTRLRTMLHCQYSFGSIVGAPVIFFLGGFVFALLQSLTIIGDESVALGLAFGQWYMTIPHIAIVSGLLLAGNNPNILEGVLATVRDDPKDRAPGFLGLRFELAYPSCYKVAWQWLRGPTKRSWIKQVIKTYHSVEHSRCGGETIDLDIDELQKRTILSLLDWSLVLTITFLLLGVPLILAFLTAFYTPEVGISCRSLTITIYACVQFGQILLWLWAYAGSPAKVEDGTAFTNFFRAGGWLESHGFYTPTSLKHFTERDPNNDPVNWGNRVRARNFWAKSLWCVIWYSTALILLITSVGAALGGTVMQLIGLYTANICKITTGSWFAPLSQRPFVLISVNSPDRIYNALQYWVPCAVTAIVFMVVVGFMAWWYQRRMRDMFTEIVRTVDEETWDRTDTRMSRREGGSAN